MVLERLCVVKSSHARHEQVAYCWGSADIMTSSHQRSSGSDFCESAVIHKSRRSNCGKANSGECKHWSRKLV